MSCFHCCDPRRLEVLQRSGSANAIVFLEVVDRAAPSFELRQRTLLVRLLHPGISFTADNVRIDGGERIRTVAVEWVAAADDLPAGEDPSLVAGVDDLPRTLVVRTATAGDFSIYTLHLVAAVGSDDAPGDFDPRLSRIEFSFKVECPSDYDCATHLACPPAPAARPDIDYLARDYPGFRRVMLDRLNLLTPGWRERSAADLGVALVELLAYAADNLAYRQDAVANEAYLGTARQRISVRRHTRLVDYFLHEGCNARAWVRVEVGGDDVPMPRGTALLTRTPHTPTVVAPDSREHRDALAAGALVFEVARDALLHADLNRLHFYTWGDAACCLSRGCTRATLRGQHPALQAGDVLILQEVVSPTTFVEGDADRGKRWAVRLTGVTATVDPSGRLFEEPPLDAPLDITEIEWDAADALPFALCVSVAERPGLEVSLAFGNMVLADHGRTIADEALRPDPVPDPKLHYAPPAADADACERPAVQPIPLRYRPTLSEQPVTHGFDLDVLLDVPLAGGEGWWPASALSRLDPRAARPAVDPLVGQLGLQVTHWHAQRDLLSSAADAPDFVVEVDDAARARLRFGDDRHGRRPDPGTHFSATYRVGNGSAGNVGAEAIAHIVSGTVGVFDALTNPMPAAGGVDPEDIEAARRDAPEAFRTQERAVTPADYAAVSERHAEVQRAAATFRWTGSWHTVFVTADRFGGGAIDARFEQRIRRHLERFRMAGYDLEVDGPRHVPLDVELHVCVKPEYFRSEVLRAVRAELSSGVLPDGRLGIFHPDRFSFGEPVYLSRIVATVQAVEGVASVSALKFERLGGPAGTAINDGFISIGRLEIAQLADDPNFRERGRIALSAGGGK